MGLVSRGQTRVVAVAGIVGMAAALLLTSCSGNSPEGATIDETTPVKTALPTPTPSPTPTTSDEEQQAIDAAIAAFNGWQALAATLGEAPQDYTLSQMKTQIYKLAGDPIANNRLSILRTFQVKGWAYEGKRAFDKIAPEGVTVDVDKSKGEYPEVKLRVCSDSSAVGIVDVKTGKAVTPASNKPKAVNHAKVWFYEGAWHVVEEEPGPKGEKC